MVVPMAESEGTATNQAVDLITPTVTSIQTLSKQKLVTKESESNQIRVSKAAENVFKKEVVNQVGEKAIRVHPKFEKISYHRFGRLYLGLGMIALAALLILILVSIPSLSGDIGCVLSLGPLMLAVIGFITAIFGLINGLLN